MMSAGVAAVNGDRTTLVFWSRQLVPAALPRYPTDRCQEKIKGQKLCSLLTLLNR
jgi:hypothetical protein